MAFYSFRKIFKFLNRALQNLCSLAQIFFPSWECITPWQGSSTPSSLIYIQYFLNPLLNSTLLNVSFCSFLEMRSLFVQLKSNPAYSTSWLKHSFLKHFSTMQAPVYQFTVFCTYFWHHSILSCAANATVSSSKTKQLSHLQLCTRCSVTHSRFSILIC